MAPNSLLGRSTNYFVKPRPAAARTGRWGEETGPRSREDDGVTGRITRKEVPHGSVYHAPAPGPGLPAPTPHRRSARTRPRRHPPRGHRPAGPHGRRGHLEAHLLHPLADLPGLLLAGPQPRPL